MTTRPCARLAANLSVLAGRVEIRAGLFEALPVEDDSLPEKERKTALRRARGRLNRRLNELRNFFWSNQMWQQEGRLYVELARRYPTSSVLFDRAVSQLVGEQKGDEVLALIVADRPGADLAREITRWCLDQLAYYKAPGWTAFVDGLPVTATEKIQRGEIRTLATDIMARGAAHDLRSMKKRR